MGRSRRRTARQAEPGVGACGRARGAVQLAKAGEERGAARARSWVRLDERRLLRGRGVRRRCVVEGLCMGARPDFERERAARWKE